MAGPLGSRNASDSAAARQQRLEHSKKKGCKKSKCSHWKGGKCRCGRD